VKSRTKVAVIGGGIAGCSTLYHLTEEGWSDVVLIERDGRHPLISTAGLVGGLWDPHDGDIDPAQLCQALAFHARRAGAQVYRHTGVTGLTRRADDTWTVHTTKGDIDADIIVNAGGYRVNEIGALMGVSHPVVSMEHQYFITETIQAIVDAGHRMPLLRCPISDYYCRQEQDGLLIGFYEQDCRPWGLGGIDPNFANDLCPDDLDRIMDVLEGAFVRMPALRQAGIKRVVNGPITYSMDGTPLVGPIPGKRNAFCIIGLRAGVGEGGGHGWLLAQQIVHGEAVYDTWCLDPRRFGPHATVERTVLKAVEDYQNEFRFHFPHEHRPAGRPARATPLYPVLKAEGAAFTVVNGWERIDYMRPGDDFVEIHSFRFNEVFDVVAAEVANVQTNVGLTEVSGFNRYEIGGADARALINRAFCTRMRETPGRVGLGYLLNHKGNITGEATIANLPDGRIWYGSAAASEVHDLDWLTSIIADGKDVTITPLTTVWTLLVLAGPNARKVLSAAARGDWSKTAFPWLSVREAHIGPVPAVVMGISFSGELAYEIHVPGDGVLNAWQTLRTAGEACGMKLFGARAVDSMRLEKGYRHWKSDLITEFDPNESGLGHFVSSPHEYVGKAALEAHHAPRRKFLTLTLDCDHAPAHPGDSVTHDGKVVGTVTSAGWGHRVSKNIAMAFVDPACAAEGTALAVDVIGEPQPATVVAPGLYDPAGSLLWS